MAIAFLVLSALALVCTLVAIRPPRVELLGVPAFAVGWLTSELAPQLLVWQVAAAGVFAVLGALRRPVGVLGLGLSIASWFGLAGLAVHSARTGGIVRRALADQLPGPAPTLGPPGPWSELALPLLLRDPAVEVTRGVPYVEGGGRAQQLDVYRHRSHPQGARVLVYIHGGAWVLGDKREQGLPLLLHLAASGWVCVSVNHRLSPAVRWPTHLVDVKAALAWVRGHIAEHGGDPARIVVSGGSAGGHLAAMAALTPGDPEYQPGFEAADTAVLACVSLYGVLDLTNRDGLRGPGFSKWLLARSVMPAPYEQDPRAWERASPLDRVGAAAPPFLVVQGTNDTLVPVGEARHFVSALREVSRSPVVYLELPGAQHAFDTFRSLRCGPVVRGIAAFLDAVVPPGPPTEAAGDADGGFSRDRP